MNWLGRLVWRVQFHLHAEKMLNRRVEVENHLAESAAGKRPLPDKAKCRELAVKLGTFPERKK